MREWLGTLTRAIDEAKKAGHIKSSVSASGFALEIYSMAVGAHWALQLLDQKEALSNARRLMRSRIRSQVTPAVRGGRLARFLKF